MPRAGMFNAGLCVWLRTTQSFIPLGLLSFSPLLSFSHKHLFSLSFPCLQAKAKNSHLFRSPNDRLHRAWKAGVTQARSNTTGLSRPPSKLWDRRPARYVLLRPFPIPLPQTGRATFTASGFPVDSEYFSPSQAPFECPLWRSSFEPDPLCPVNGFPVR